MKVAIFVLGWIYLLAILPVFSVIGNLIALTKMLFSGRVGEVRREMKRVRDLMLNLAIFQVEYQKFTWVKDGIVGGDSVFSKWPTWVPLACVVVYKKLSDNCDGADVYARWLMRKLKSNVPGDQLSIETKIMVPCDLSLWSKKIHYISVVRSEDSTLVLSSGKIYATADVNTFAASYISPDGKEAYVWLK